VLIGLGALALGAAAITLAQPEVSDELLLKLAPKSFRQQGFSKFEGPGGAAVYLLGAIHGEHLTTKDYSLLDLQSVILNLRPDLLLVESRPEALAAGEWADGPIEMAVASLTARASGIAVRGIDWWAMNAAHAVDDDMREAHMFANIAAALPGQRKVLILTGFSHAPTFRTKLSAAGWRLSPFSAAQKDQLFDAHGRTFVFPAGMTAAVKRRIAADTLTLQGVTDPFWRERLTDAVAARRRLLDVIAKVGEARP
jgi:hypothetical protein